MERLFKNYVTTILAVLIVVYCGIMQGYFKSEWSELAGFWALALMLFRTKDSIINLPKEKENTDSR